MFEELLLGLLGFGLFAALVGCTIVLPLVAFARTRRIAALGSRLARLEEAIRDGTSAAPMGEGPAPAGDYARRLDDLEARLARLEGTHLPARVPEPTVPGPAALPPVEERPRPVRRAAPEPVLPVLPVHFVTPWEREGVSLEDWIGRRWLGWLAVVLLLFATAFFLKYAFENRWIGELGRVTLGILAGIGLCVAGFRFHDEGWRRFSHMLSAGGVALLYLSTFAAFGYYHLLPQQRAAVFLIALVAETAALAVLYEAPGIAIMAVLGGLLAPILLHTDRDQYRSLFVYLTILNAGTVAIALFRRWRVLGLVGLLGTQLLFWIWYHEHYHPEKLGAALGFQLVVFSLYLAYGLAAHVAQRLQANVEDLVRWLLNTVLVSTAGYVLLDEDYHLWMGTLAIGMATLYAALAWLILRKRPDDERQLVTVLAMATAYVALAIPLQAQAAWIPVGWAVLGALLWWFGLRVEKPALRVGGFLLLVIATGRLVFLDTPYADRAPFVPFFNRYGLPALLVVACILSAPVAARRLARYLLEPDHVLAALAGLGGIGLLWFVLSVETYTAFTAHLKDPGADVDYLRQAAQMTLSIVWAAYAGTLLWAGFRFRIERLRWAALAVFGVTLVKVVLVDMAGLPGLYRVLAFLALSLVMGAAAWGYQRVQRLRPTAAREEMTHEPV